ncbi:MAG: tRNA-dihydrouridine synthase family protein [Candidatus Krumholzibacteriia bacterium]
MTEPSPDRADFFRGRLVMAPMATGGNLPYRRLCREFGAELTCSEMVMADKLAAGGRGELPLLRRHASEAAFGVQLCGKSPEVMAEAAVRAVDLGARFIDLNFGCPIDLVVRRGAGAALLKKPQKLAQVVAAVRARIAVPLSVKLRAGYEEGRINALETARAAAEAGADALMLHGRTREQRYRRPADWEIIARVVAAVDVPVIGNGDLLTPWDARARRAESGVASLLVARGALIKPWIFRELAEGRAILPSLAERWALLRRYYDHATEHFGDDEKGQSRVRRFFFWHLGFWLRYRPYTEADYLAAAPEPLIQTRAPAVVGEADAVLLASAAPADHEAIWRRVLDRDYPAA